MEALTKAAEQQLRRRLPDEAPAKRHKQSADVHPVARYHYAAASTITQGATCILISCAYKRELSAVKEAVPLLQRYINEDLPPTNAASDGTDASVFSMIKVDCEGLVLLKLDREGLDPTRILSKLAADIDKHKHLQPRFCQRFHPIQITCSHHKGSFQAACTRLAEAYYKQTSEKGDVGGTAARTFAVVYKKRGDQGAASNQGSKGGQGNSKPASAPPSHSPREPSTSSVPSASSNKDGGNQALQALQVNPGAAGTADKAATHQHEEEGATGAAKTAAVEGDGGGAPASQADVQANGEKEEKASADRNGDGQVAAVCAAPEDDDEVLNRQGAINIAARAMIEAFAASGDLKVDLRNPQVVVMVECMPIASHVVYGLCILPANLLAPSRAKLSVRPLTPMA